MFDIIFVDSPRELEPAGRPSFVCTLVHIPAQMKSLEYPTGLTWYGSRDSHLHYYCKVGWFFYTFYVFFYGYTIMQVNIH